MDFRHIPKETQPAYTWLWNGTVTREGIDWQIDEMERNGIKAFYVIGEPENWFPERRATHLYPPYLSEEYLELLFYAFQRAREKGMYTWLYNEGAFPSGSACGLVTQKHPELAFKYFSVRKFTLRKGRAYRPGERALGAFVGERRVREGWSPEADTEVLEYYWDCCGDRRLSIRVDNADRRGTREFINETHERLKKRFGKYMGTEIAYMFDDEAFMGGWTMDLEKIFLERYGYDITDYLQYLPQTYCQPHIPPTTEAQLRAVSDYIMLCGDLLRENYFEPMRHWLRENNMLSVGHLDNDDKSMGAYVLNYGNVLRTMRAFDVPGIDVIWEQISYPREGSCCHESMEMFPRLASSAARQIGRNVALSESFAVYGAHVTPELMRFVVNFQAVRGINLFNFMVMSYDREGPMRHQYRPNYLGDNVGMDCLKQINDYTARLSNIMQQSKAVVRTALYYPLRSICAGGELGKRAAKAFEDLGKMLEDRGVSFDFVDEELILGGKLREGRLVCEHVEYDNVFPVPGDLELPEVTEKLSLLNSRIEPDLIRTEACLQTRRVRFEDGSDGYFLFNQGNSLLREAVQLQSDKWLYEVDLMDGETYEIPYTRDGGRICLEIGLLRGEGKFLLLTGEEKAVPRKPLWEEACRIRDVKSCISRIYQLDREKGVKNSYPEPVWQAGFVEWEEGLSGEATYICRIPPLEPGEYRLKLGQVRHCAKVYLNGERIGESTVAPHTVALRGIRGGEELKIIVANTPANECARSNYFSRYTVQEVGPYHAKMVLAERKEGPGGLLGPVVLERKSSERS